MVVAFPAHGTCKHCSSTTVTFGSEDWMRCTECGEIVVSWIEYQARVQARLDSMPVTSQTATLGVKLMRSLRSKFGNSP
jgi:uncharacterized Zn finger protein